MVVVYLHRRADTGEVFYVGKGSVARANFLKARNPFWKRVKDKAGGCTVEIISEGDDEFCLMAEIETINILRRRGVRLTNLTDGGEGTSGLPRPDASARFKGVPKSHEHRAKLSLLAKARRALEETRRKMSETRRGRPSAMLGKKHREESKEKIAAANRGELNRFFGKQHSLESLAKMSASHIGHKDSPETRAKKSAARKGENNPRFGVRISEEQKQQQIAALKARPLLTCPHCGKAMNEGNAKRWHFDNCKGRS